MASLPRIDPQQVLAFRFPQVNFTYTERDVALYALGVGAAGADACNPSELPFVYHPDGQSAIKVLPTFTVLFPRNLLSLCKTHQAYKKRKLGFKAYRGGFGGLHPKFVRCSHDSRLLLHGEQYLEIYKPLPTTANMSYVGSSYAEVFGRAAGKAAVVEFETLSHNKDTGDVLRMNRNTVFLRGAGGFSSSGKPYSFSDRTPPKTAPQKGISIADKQPDLCLKTALTNHRLSGDYNPLHADPAYARKAGFPRPILHGLCTLGYATRAVVTRLCVGDPTMVQSVQGRFLLHVFPGETLVTEMWTDKTHNRVDYKLKVKERNKVVLSGSLILSPTISSL